MNKFPVLFSHNDNKRNIKFIPWEVIAPHERQAFINHGQSLEKLAQRGGCGWREIYVILSDKPYDHENGEKYSEVTYRCGVLEKIGIYYCNKIAEIS